jgi:membrane protein YqaA with SNARE-associated domain
MNPIEQAAYDVGFEDGIATRQEAVAQEFAEKRALEQYTKTLERRCEWFRRALIGAAVVATCAVWGPFLAWISAWVSR